MVLTISALSFRRIFFREVEFEGLELLIAIKVAFEMLKKHHFLVDCLWVVEEIKLVDLVSQAFCGLSIIVHNRLLL